MLIDWFTVSAQAANFLILVWLLKRFLYKPILTAIAAREKLIADQLQDAAAKQIEAQNERDNFQRRNEEFEKQRVTLFDKVVEEVKTERQKLLECARKDSESLRFKLQESVKNERENLAREIVTRTQREVFDIARKTLADLSTVSLEERLGEVFIRRLRGMTGQAKEELAKALNSSYEPALVRSMFGLPAEQQAAIQNALNETFSSAIRIRFETATNLVCGIELIANGQKIGWSVADYLASLEKGVGGIFDAEVKPVVLAEAQ